MSGIGLIIAGPVRPAWARVLLIAELLVQTYFRRQQQSLLSPPP